MFNFFRKKNFKDGKYKIDSENLAVPEIHTGEVEECDSNESSSESITFDDVAIPEIHIKKKGEK